MPSWCRSSGIRAIPARTAARGAAVLLISEDLDELFALSDRIGVLSQGRLSPPEPVEDLTVESVGLLMAGHGLERNAA